MTTITPEYRAMNRTLHEVNQSYGAGNATSQWYPAVNQLAQIVKPRSILDYGAGKMAMGQALSHLMVIPYDPSVPGIDETPETHDMVVSLDVLEHIEPDCLDAVLDEIKRCALKAVFLTINMMPAAKTLADGRNAHLIQKPIEWWLPKLMDRWHLLGVTQRGYTEFVFTGEPHSQSQRNRKAA